VVLTAVPATGSTFTGWTGGCTGTSTTCTTTITGATSVAATFTLQRFLLSVERIGTGSGGVFSGPPDIDCGGDGGCAAVFDFGQVVTLTGFSFDGSIFEGWSGGGCTGTGICTITITGTTDVTARFTLQRFPLSVTRAGTGTGTVTSSPAAINCGGTCTANFDFGQRVTLTATPGANSAFTGWAGGGCSGTGTCTITITAATGVTATFTRVRSTLTLVFTGSGAGRVTSAPGGINCTANCTATFNVNQIVTLTPTPLGSSGFGSWTGAGCSDNPTCSFAMASDVTVSVNFEAVGLR
jgi:uncharacterized repeat protein (TIGR02543 family)